MNFNLLGDGLVLLVLGMGMVFVFLAIMVGLMTLSARILSRYSHLFPPDAPAAARQRSPRAQDEEGQLIAVLTAAVRRYQRDHR